MSRVENYNGVEGLTVLTDGGAVESGQLPSIADGLAMTAQRLLEIRDAFLQIPHVGDWLVANFNGGVDPSLIQLFPNAERLKTTELRRESAERMMSWIKGDWRVHNHVSRHAKVRMAGHDLIVVMHHVDGMVIGEPKKKEGTNNA